MTKPTAWICRSADGRVKWTTDSRRAEGWTADKSKKVTPLFTSAAQLSALDSAARCALSAIEAIRQRNLYRKAVLDLLTRGHGVMRPKWLLAAIERAKESK